MSYFLQPGDVFDPEKFRRLERWFPRDADDEGDEVVANDVTT